MAHVDDSVSGAVEVFVRYLLFCVTNISKADKKLICCESFACRIVVVLQYLVCCTAWSKRCFFQG